MSLESAEGSKDVRSVTLLHQECHSKDVSRLSLQIAHRESCAPVCRDLIGTDEAMMACHKSKNLKKIMIPSRSKDSENLKLKEAHML